MVKVQFERLEKIYPNGFKAVHELDLDINIGKIMI